MAEIWAFPLNTSWRCKTMSRILPSISRFLVSEDGPAAVEYAVMLALILVACISVVTSLGTKVSSTFNAVSSGIAS